ncbi:MAG: DUF4249 family protein [Cyclobacteriaceae bacterium]
MKKFGSIVFTVLLIAGCESLDLPEGGSSQLVVVEGWLTDQLETHHVSLSLSSSFTSKEDKPVIDNANVFVLRLTPTSNAYPYDHIGGGVYESKEPFAAEINATYQLIVELEDGTLIRSNIQSINDLSQIDSLYTGTIERENEEDPDILDTYYYPIVTTSDSPIQDNYYRWTISRNDTLLIGTKNLEILSDQFFDGNTINHELTGFEFDLDDFMMIEQQQLSSEVFNFLQLVKEQTTLLGTVNSTSPASIEGNLSFSNKDETILGYWGVISIDRDTLTVR